MAGVRLEKVRKAYGSVVALQEMDLEIEEGEFLTLLGPSGCGKTTTLRLIAGFVEPTSGNILLGDEDVTGLPPQHRKIGMVFQDYALFPHLTIHDNIGFGLKERGAGKAEIEARVRELLELVQLPGVESRYPSELSGGQAQRIAVARAVAYPPRVLLMDEPLGALDLKLRETMQIELRRIQRELKITTVFVTHDQTEAMNMSDRIVVMNHGLIEQVGTAEEIYDNPKTKFVADFVGQINLIEGDVIETKDGFATLKVGEGTAVRARMPNGVARGAFAIAIRPEHLRILEDQNSATDANQLDGKVVGTIFSGNLLKVFVDIGMEKPLVLEDRPQNVSLAEGASVRVAWSPGDGILLKN
ncbi:MAG: ABC transporter ATP-binding protein [Kiloniellales bacterium]|nr:ABC transporter ATP-binding protein [Kiloniellales bacterium]